MKLTARNLHRDLGYFYVGLIIAFSISGILLNHRQAWNASKYKAETKNINIEMPANEADLTEEFAAKTAEKLGIKDAVRRVRIDEGKFSVSFEKHDLKVDAKTGAGELVRYVKVPVIAQMTQLHKDTSQWWIYYSDVFGLAMLTIAVTGMLMIPQGPLSFKQRGWKLALIGMIFPLIFLFLLS